MGVFNKGLGSDNYRRRKPIRAAKKDDNPLAQIIKKVGYAISGGNNDSFQAPAFNLQQVEDAYNTDSYVRQAIDKYNELMFKAGWDIVSRNDKVSEYMDKRLTMLSMAMGQPMDKFLRNISDDLVKYSNVFIVKARKKPKDMPQVKGVNVKGLGKQKPIAAYFRLPPQTMQVKVDKHGTIKKYKQIVGGDEKEFKPEDIIHITYKKPAGRFFGVPMILPALEDVKLLREVEDNVARLIYRHLYPLFVYKIGLDKPGYEASDDEIETMQQEISDMPTEGGLVVPERHDIEVIGTDGEALDAKEYLEYYERRTFTGLGVSETLMGRGDTSNRSTAETQSTEMRDKVKAFQKVMQDAINYYIIRELLMEGGFDPLANPDHQAGFQFKEIDMDLKIKQENHTIYKYEHNATTHEEMREGLGMDPVSDENRLYGNMFGDTGNTDDTDNRESPSNQHSQETFLNKELKGSIAENMIGGEYLELKNEVVDMVKCFNDGLQEKNELEEQVNQFVKSKQNTVETYLGTYIRTSFKKGVNRGIEEIFADNSKNLTQKTCKSAIAKLQLEAENKLTEFSDNLENKIIAKVNDENLENKELVSNILAIFSIVEYELVETVRKLLILSYNYGFSKVGDKFGYEKVDLAKQDKKVSISLNDNYLNKLPSYTPKTEYYLSFNSSEERGVS